MAHDLYKTYTEVYNDLSGIGIIPGTLKSLSFNTRFRSTLGMTRRKNGENTFAIEIASFMLNDAVPAQELKNVIAHELIHTLPGCQDHGAKWKKYASYINKNCPGYNVTRTAEISQIADHDRIIPGHNYVLRCKNCGQIIKRSRRSKLIKHYYLYRCGKCGGRLEDISGT